MKKNATKFKQLIESSHAAAGYVLMETLEQRALRSAAPDPGSTLATAFNVGNLTDANFQDFVGLGPSLHDPTDTYKIKMTAPGKLMVFLRNDVSSDAILTHVDVIHDFNGNGVIDPGDELFPSSTGGTTQRRSKDVPAGTYFVQVVSDLGSANYRLNINADYAGTTATTVRPMGSLDSLKSFNDFIAQGADNFDDYSFSVSQTRPLFAAVAEPGNGTSAMMLFKDANNNGVAENSEFITQSRDGHFSSLLESVTAGHYILRVLSTGGIGTYTLSAETRPDGAGNSLKTAKNLGTANGLKHVDDYVSAEDPADFYKFTASASATIGASVIPEFGGVVDFALIRDANNNGVVDNSEILAKGVKASTGAKELSKSITAGNYFLRVSHPPAIQVTKYFLSFQTDYAGGTPKTGANVGALSGTKNFDDWASGPFGGVISDTEDVYKFSLSSTKSFSAKMTGTLNGQELNLLLYRDKNKDGVLTASELVASSSKKDSPNEQITKSLSAGTYFVRVAGLNGETNYHLTLKA